MKTFLISIILLNFVTNTYAQPFYIKAGGGYAAGLETSFFERGCNARVAVGFDSPRKLQFSFIINYTAGTMHTPSYYPSSRLFLWLIEKQESRVYETTRHYNSRTISLTPAIKFSPFDFETWKPYMQLGLTAGFGNVKAQDKFMDSSARITVISMIKSQALGGLGVLGMEYKMNERCSFFVESDFTVLSYKCKLRDTEQGSYFVSQDMSFYELADYRFINGGINAGLKYTFAKKKEAEPPLPE